MEDENLKKRKRVTVSMLKNSITTFLLLHLVYSNGKSLLATLKRGKKERMKFSFCIEGFEINKFVFTDFFFSTNTHTLKLSCFPFSPTSSSRITE